MVFKTILKRLGIWIMYNSKSNIATEFIDDEEILNTLEYARQNKENRDLIE